MIKLFSKTVVFCQLLIQAIIDRFLCYFYKRLMFKCGNNVILKPSTSVILGLENIIIGDCVTIGKYATIFCSDSKLVIGNKVVFGPKVTIIAGNHVTNIVGKYMWDIKTKEPGVDKDVVLEDDIWIGANATILTGVTIGRGSVVAAGSLVNKSCPPYSIIGGVPARVLKFRFTIDQILQHECQLYNAADRFTLNEIEDHRKNIFI